MLMDDFEFRIRLMSKILKLTKGLDGMYLNQFSNSQLKTYLDRLEFKKIKLK